MIPDSSPLISLAIGNSLDLFLKLDLPVRLVDVVYLKTVLNHEKPGGGVKAENQEMEMEEEDETVGPGYGAKRT